VLNSTSCFNSAHVAQISVGLAASIALLLLSLPSSLFAVQRDSDLPIDGTGILHTIWLYRNHPELETLLEQVDHPTEENLRDAGMVQTRLVGGPQRRRPGVRCKCECLCPPAVFDEFDGDCERSVDSRYSWEPAIK
jgi:hypothetical protein